jgi:hypothetical protein
MKAGLRAPHLAALLWVAAAAIFVVGSAGAHTAGVKTARECPPGEHWVSNGAGGASCVAGATHHHAKTVSQWSHPAPMIAGAVVSPALSYSHSSQPPSAAPSLRPGLAGAGGSAAPAGARPDTALVLARAYVRAADIPPQGVGAYGVVSLRAKATPSNRQRLLRLCAAYQAYLPPQASLPASVKIGDQMLTIWPLENPSAPQARADDCGYAVDGYDLYGGQAAIRDAERQGAKLDGDGPYLLGWSPSDTRGVPNTLVLVVDMSSFESQDSFNQAFLFWQKKVVENPELWRHGFEIASFRLALRDFSDHYGDAILQAIKLIGGK